MERETEDKLRMYDSYLATAIQERQETIDCGKFRNSTNRIAQGEIEALEEARSQLYEFFPELKIKSSP